MMCLVDPCDGHHGCQEKCVKDDTPEMFHCECKSPEFKLATNGKDCIEGNLFQGLTITSILIIHYNSNYSILIIRQSLFVLFIAQ